MVISKLHFFQIQGKFFKRDAMIFNQSFFSIAQETLQAINIDFSGREDLLLIHSKMTITTKHQSITLSEFISIDSIALAPYAEMTMIFKQPLPQKTPCSIFRPNNELKRLYAHLH